MFDKFENWWIIKYSDNIKYKSFNVECIMFLIVTVFDLMADIIAYIYYSFDVLEYLPISLKKLKIHKLHAI